jgi:hypothetical protein
MKPCCPWCGNPLERTMQNLNGEHWECRTSGCRVQVTKFSERRSVDVEAVEPTMGDGRDPDRT